MSEEEDIKNLEASLIGLAECEKEMDKAEREAEIFRINKTQKIYQKRSEILSKIPTFWYIVLAENDDFAEYISSDDLKYLEDISNIYVEYDIANNNPRDFKIIISFDGELTPKQTITKSFKTLVNEQGEEYLTSESVDIEWPQQLQSINPKTIKSNSKKQNGSMSAEDKKNYRIGMKSFFSFFTWTGEKPGKEFRNGEDLARLIVDNLFPYAVKYYTEALPAGSEDLDDDEDDEDDEDSSEGEELDLSADEKDDEPQTKKQKT